MDKEQRRTEFLNRVKKLDVMDVIYYASEKGKTYNQEKEENQEA